MEPENGERRPSRVNAPRGPLNAPGGPGSPAGSSGGPPVGSRPESLVGPPAGSPAGSSGGTPSGAPRAPRPSAEAHATHDELLIAALVGGDLAPADLARAEALVASCPACAALRDELRGIAAAVRTMPVPPRPRDFILTAHLLAARRGRRRSWGADLRSRLGAVLGGGSPPAPLAPRVLRWAGIALVVFGLAGVGAGLSLQGGASAPFGGTPQAGTALNAPAPGGTSLEAQPQGSAGEPVGAPGAAALAPSGGAGAATVVPSSSPGAAALAPPSTPGAKATAPAPAPPTGPSANATAPALAPSSGPGAKATAPVGGAPAPSPPPAARTTVESPPGVGTGLGVLLVSVGVAVGLLGLLLLGLGLVSRAGSGRRPEG
jgi:hypothetical protein